MRITIRIDETDFREVQQAIKKKYPEIKNVSELVRAALKEFLSKEN